MIMQGRQLTPRDRRTLMFGALVIAAIVISGRVVPACLRWRSAAQHSANLAGLTLARSRAELVGRRAAHDSLVARRARLDSLHVAWLEGDTPAAAGASLAGEISSAGERAGVTVGALDIRVDSGSNAAFVPMRVQATATGDIQGIVNFLAGIESNRVDLSIRAISIDAANAASSASQPEVLRVDLTVEAPWRRVSHE